MPPYLIGWPCRFAGVLQDRRHFGGEFGLAELLRPGLQFDGTNLPVPCFKAVDGAGKPIVLVSPIQVSCSARLAFGCWLFGSLLRTLAILCTRGPLKKAPMPDSVLVNDSQLAGTRYARTQGAGSTGALHHRVAHQ